MISVVIPTYNRAYILSRALKSVLGQTLQDFEVIIVDDGSTDNTVKIVEDFNDGRIHYIRHAENQGEPAASNTGIRESKGEFITFLDSDDEMVLDKLEKQAALLRTDESLGVVFTDILERRPNQEKRIWTPYDPPKSFCVSSGLFRREVFTKAGFFDEDLELCFDDELGMRIIQHYPVRLIKEVLMTRDRTPDAKSMAPDAGYTRYESYKTIYQKHFSFLVKRFGRKYGADQLYGWGKFLLKNGRVKESRSWFLRSIITDPFQLRSFIKFIKTFFSS